LSLRSSFPSRRRLAIAVAAAVALAAALLFGWPYLRYLQTHESTDDAYVDGSTATVTSRVTGTVVAVEIGENWSVKRDDVLVRLDPRDFQVALDQANARLARARQTVDELRAAYAAAESTLALSQEKLDQAQLDFDRTHKLHAAGVASQEAYDHASTALRVARADRAVADHQLQQARAALGGPPDAADPYDTPIVREAAAAVEAAQLDLDYTVIRAPLAGSVADKHVAVGDRVQQGQPLMTLVPPPSTLYVTANFKETQLEEMRVGQPAEIRADSYPGTVFRAHVDSLSMGTGAAFALLPAENATGNWVKVVQRLPVRLVFDEPPPPDKPLRMGLSVEAAVDVHDTHGSLLASQAQERAPRPAGALALSLDDPSRPAPAPLPSVR
jgi:membrane fusion protein (multidrug efflux system)